jgi:hypothetical protein
VSFAILLMVLFWFKVKKQGDVWQIRGSVLGWIDALLIPITHLSSTALPRNTHF